MINTETVVIEPSTELVKIVETSGLEKTKANYILERFQDYFKIAADWEQKAKILVVSSPSQVTEMKMAREGRLFLRQKRIDIEKARKELKEQALREGKAIDGIANVLKALIEPIEDYLDRQERFVEIMEDEVREKRKESRITEMLSLQLDPTMFDVKNMPEDKYRQLVNETRLAIQQRIDAELRAETDRIAKEKADTEERERIRLENERLKKEAKLKEEQLAKERVEAGKQRLVAEEKARKERAEAEAREKKLKIEQETKLKKERDERERLEAQLKAKAEAEAREKKLAADQEQAAKRAPDREKLLTLAETIESIETPSVKSEEAKKILVDVGILLMKTVKFIREQTDKL